MYAHLCLGCPHTRVAARGCRHFSQGSLRGASTHRRPTVIAPLSSTASCIQSRSPPVCFDPSITGTNPVLRRRLVALATVFLCAVSFRFFFRFFCSVRFRIRFCNRVGALVLHSHAGVLDRPPTGERAESSAGPAGSASESAKQVARVLQQRAEVAAARPGVVLVEDAGQVVRQARAGPSVREHVGTEHLSAGRRAGRHGWWCRTAWLRRRTAAAAGGGRRADGGRTASQTGVRRPLNIAASGSCSIQCTTR